MTDIQTAIIAWDRDTFFAINNGLQNRLFDLIMPPISDLGLGHLQVLAVLFAALLAGVKRREIRRAGFWVAAGRSIARRKGWVVPLFAALALSGAASAAIKQNVDRHRPDWFYRHEHAAGRSLDRKVHTIAGRRPIRVRGFLSGHTATSVALATAFSLISLRRRWSRKWAVASWIIALLVSFSRIYLADHWPLDVVAGAALGVMCGLAGVWLGDRLVRIRRDEPEAHSPGADQLVLRGAWSI